MAISAKDVMALRQRTGVGMMECKAALTEAGGDIEAAIALLREKLKGDMEERADRAANEGVIAIARGPGAVAMIELVSETDFAARNDSFVAAAEQIADLALQGADGEQTATPAMQQIVDGLRITIKENIALGRTVKLSGSVVGGYLHHNHQVAAVLAGSGAFTPDLLTGLCQHIVAAVPPLMPRPIAVAAAQLPAEAVAQQKQAFTEEAASSNKPANIIEKMVEGKLRKWIAENTLLGQTYVRELDAKKPVSHYLPEGATISAFVRFQVGA